MVAVVNIGGLPNRTTSAEIADVFRRFGRIRNVWVASQPTVFASVEYEDVRDAADAVKAMDGGRVCGVRARVELSHLRYLPVGGHQGQDFGGRRSWTRSRSPLSRSRSRSRERSRTRTPSMPSSDSSRTGTPSLPSRSSSSDSARTRSPSPPSSSGSSATHGTRSPYRLLAAEAVPPTELVRLPLLRAATAVTASGLAHLHRLRAAASTPARKDESSIFIGCTAKQNLSHHFV